MVTRHGGRKAYRKIPKSEAKRIGICAGCFTLLTPLHVGYLAEARETCDYLIALTNYDDYVRDKKSVVPFRVEERLEILRALRVVDEAWPFEGNDEAQWVGRFKNVRLSEFAPGAKVVIYHDQSVMVTEEGQIRKPSEIIGFGIADGIRMIPRKTGKSVSDIFEMIREQNEPQ